MVSITELSKGVTRAAELLTVAAAHRAFVEHCLRDQQQTGHQLAEMVEGWVTGEDAIEVACWHMQFTSTCNLAHGKRPRTETARGLGPVSGSVHGQELRAQVESSGVPAMLVAAEQEQRLCHFFARPPCRVCSSQ